MALIEYCCDLKNNVVNFKDPVKGSQLAISFHRTIRVPDNARSSSLPPDLGRFPLYKVKDYEGKLPTVMAAKGGLFMPMYQKEAMWINFESTMPFLIKIYSGGVNVISGEHYVEDPGTKLRRQTLKANGKNLQDYVVVPEQLWLDGIASSRGVVRQFVAMPSGSGYSVEAQLTGKDAVGGLQFEITPGSILDYPISLSVKTLTGKIISISAKASDTINDINHKIELKEGLSPHHHQKLIYKGERLQGERTLDSYGIPKVAKIHLIVILRGGSTIIPPQEPKKVEMSIAAGGKISQTIGKDQRPNITCRKMPPMTFNLQILNSAGFKSVTGQAPPPTPVSMQTYVGAGLPFFAMYEEPSDVSGDFEGIKSIGELDKQPEAIIKIRLVYLDQEGRRVDTHTVVNSSACCKVVDNNGILNGSGPLRAFRTVADIERDLDKFTLVSFD